MSDETPVGAHDRDSSPSELRSLIETAFLLGVGAASLSKDRLESLVDELVARGRQSRETVHTLTERLTEKSGQEVRAMLHRLDRTVLKNSEEGRFATVADLDDIDFRLRQIEHRIGLLETRIDRCTGGTDS